MALITASHPNLILTTFHKALLPMMKSKSSTRPKIMPEADVGPFYGPEDISHVITLITYAGPVPGRKLGFNLPRRNTPDTREQADCYPVG